MYGEELTIGLSIADIQDFVAVLDAVTPEDVMAVAQEVLNRDRAVTGWLTRPGEPEGIAAEAPGTERPALETPVEEVAQ